MGRGEALSEHPAPCSSWSVPPPSILKSQGHLRAGARQDRGGCVQPLHLALAPLCPPHSLLAPPEQEQGLHAALSSHPVYLLLHAALGEPVLVPILCPGGGAQTAQVPGPQASPI